MAPKAKPSAKVKKDEVIEVPKTAAIPDGKKTWTIDPAGAFHGGPAFADFPAMRAVVATKSEDFAHGFTSALVEYALGRPCGFSDEELVEGIVSRAKSKNYMVREFIHALVESRAFHTK